MNRTISLISSNLQTFALREMSELIEERKADGWWQFPPESLVAGFMGTRYFLVGDQPSMSDWNPWNPNRRALYDLLPQIGQGCAHLTDLYKVRGKAGSLRTKLPDDFQYHIEFFRAELALLKPDRVVALGHLAYRLLKCHVPEVRPVLGRAWHFAYVVRFGKTAAYKDNMERALRIG